MYKLQAEGSVMCPACLQPALSITDQAMFIEDGLHYVDYQANCAACGYHLDRSRVPFTSAEAMRQLIYGDLNTASGSSLYIAPRQRKFTEA